MRALLDTHALLWWLDGDERLSGPARAWVGEQSHAVLVSAASAWEIATKARIGKLPGATEVVENFHACMTDQGFTPLSITADHALRAGSLPGPHHDPFDRLLIAQALAENIPLISNETLFDGYGVRRIW